MPATPSPAEGVAGLVFPPHARAPLPLPSRGVGSMNRLAIAIVVVGTLTIGITIWQTLPKKRSTAVVDPSKYRYMHCPDCQREQIYSPTASDMCLRCSKRMIPTAESVRQN